MKQIETTFVYISDIYNFVKASQECKHRVNVKQGFLTVDGRSILGILSLDLFSSIIIEFDSEDEETVLKGLNQ